MERKKKRQAYKEENRRDEGQRKGGRENDMRDMLHYEKGEVGEQGEAMERRRGEGQREGLLYTFVMDPSYKPEFCLQ